MFAAKKSESVKAEAEKPSAQINAKGENAEQAQANPLWTQLATRIQAKLAVSAPDDPLEREADRVAEQVVRLPERPSSAQTAAETTVNPVWKRLSLGTKPKVGVSSMDDPYERDADQVADQGRRMPDRLSSNYRLSFSSIRTPTAQRKCAACEEEEKLQRKEGGSTTEPPATAFPIVHETLSALGHPLDSAAREFFEPRFGHDFSGVRVHSDARAAGAARALEARAFTLGAHIAFASGEYAPESREGRRLLAHELAHVVQQGRTAAPAAPTVARTPLVQRQPADAPVAGGDDAALAAEFEQQVEAALAGMNQDVDLMLRAVASRRHLLLTKRAHPPLKTREDLDGLTAEVDRLAKTELDTLGAFSAAAAELALAGYAKGFPLTWSGRVKAALTFGVEPAAIAEAFKALAELTAKATPLHPAIYAHGLPLPFDEVGRADGFKLRVTDAHAEKESEVRDYARDSIRYVQVKFVLAFMFTWEKIVGEIAAKVADGTLVPMYLDWKEFVDNKQAKLRELPARAREQLAKTDEEAEKLRNDALDFGKATLLSGMIGALSSLFAVLDGWSDAQSLFDKALKQADASLAAAGRGERLVAAINWAIDNDYFGGAAKAWAKNLIAHGAETLAETAALVVAGLILEIPVAIYLAATTARDVLELLTELGLSLDAVMQAKNVAELQQASARLAQILTNGAITILIVLLTMGVGKLVSKVRKRAAELRAAEPALTEEAATKRALQEMSAEERAALEEGPAKVAKKFKEFAGVCALGSINCRKLPDHILAEAGKYPKGHDVPMPVGPFSVQKAALILTDIERDRLILRDIAKRNRKLWPEFDKALARAEKRGEDWVYDSNGKAWEVHHIKPVFMGGENHGGNLIPLPKAIHLEYSNWWMRVHAAFKKRFAPNEWDEIYWNERDVPGSKVPRTPQR